MIRPFAVCVSIEAFDRLSMLYCSLFWIAPNFACEDVIWLIAVSKMVTAVAAPCLGAKVNIRDVSCHRQHCHLLHAK